MRSLIIIEVEHGEDTDDLTDTVQEIADNIYSASCWNRNLTMTNHTVRVDLPECFVLDSTHTNH